MIGSDHLGALCSSWGHDVCYNICYSNHGTSHLPLSLRVLLTYIHPNRRPLLTRVRNEECCCIRICPMLCCGYVRVLYQDAMRRQRFKHSKLFISAPPSSQAFLSLRISSDNNPGPRKAIAKKPCSQQCEHDIRCTASQHHPGYRPPPVILTPHRLFHYPNIWNLTVSFSGSKQPSEADEYPECG